MKEGGRALVPRAWRKEEGGGSGRSSLPLRSKLLYPHAHYHYLATLPNLPFSALAGKHRLINWPWPLLLGVGARALV